MRALGACLALAILVGCGAKAEAPPADAGLPAGPLPLPAALLAPQRYDCTAAATFAPPARPTAAACLWDPECRERLVTGHRIATPFAPENSLSALRAAILLGVDVVEIDVRLTADGEVVVLHDEELDRTTTATGPVSRRTLAELRAIPLVTAGHHQGDFSCDRVPTLAEVMALARDRVVVMVEVKRTEAGVKAAAYLQQEGLMRDAFLLCDPGECAAARAAVPDVPLMTRPRAPREVPAAVEGSPAPLLVHLDATREMTTPQILGAVRAAGAKPFANGFILGDLPAGYDDDLAGYLSVYDLGIQVMQVENPHWALLALGRLQLE